MEINILVVEDDLQKFGQIKSVVLRAGVAENQIRHAANSIDALAECKNGRFDLLLLDVNLPRRFDEAPSRGEGIALLRRINRDPDAHKPRYIVGVTAFNDVLSEFGESFADQLWTLIQYSENSDRWQSQIMAKVEYVSALRRSDNFSDGKTFGIDVAVVCALADPEWSALCDLPCEWQALRLPHDQTRYMMGVIETPARKISIVSAAAPRMGMPASSVLAAKIITSFRPKIIGMTGICAGRSSKTELGDVVVAEPAFDWGSGKIDSVDKVARFRPSPSQLDIPADIAESIKETFRDPALLATIRSKCTNAPARGSLKVHVAPMASGAAVVANAALFEELLDKNRDITGLDMEAYGVFVAASGAAKPRPVPLVMKGVCDFADEEKDDDYQNFSAQVSARCFIEAVKALFSKEAEWRT